MMGGVSFPTTIVGKRHMKLALSIVLFATPIMINLTRG